MNKIDVVIAWVDGSDPDHAAKRRGFQDLSEVAHSEAIVETRFGNCGEIYYCLASILKYAKFINKVWIVTDAQEPKHLSAFADAGLCDPDFIQVVDHKTIFKGYESALPTFNSISIEAMIWRIPGLAENFIYMNDDFFINRPVTPDFLFKDERPVLRGWMARPAHRRLKVKIRRRLRKLTFRPPNSRPSFRISMELGSNVAGITEDFLHVAHHPHPMRKSVLEEFFAHADKDILKEQVSYRFRDVKQYNQASLANHLEIANHHAEVKEPVGVAYFKPCVQNKANHPSMDLIRREVEPYGCLQSLDECSPEVLRTIRAYMAEKFGDYLPDQIDFQNL